MQSSNIELNQFGYRTKLSESQSWFPKKLLTDHDDHGGYDDHDDHDGHDDHDEQGDCDNVEVKHIR